MMMRAAIALCIGVAGLLGTGDARSHSASDAYLTLEVDAPSAMVRGQWDIALRDLDFVLTLDDDGHGDITWAELRAHQAAIARYATAHLKVLGDGKSCPLAVTKQLVGNHADGAYAVVYFEARCASIRQQTTLEYSLFFAVDPSHRAIVVAHTAGNTATALMSPEKAHVDLKTAPPSGSAGRVPR